MVILCVMKQNVYLNSLLFTHTLSGGSLRRHHGHEFCKQTKGSVSVGRRGGREPRAHRYAKTVNTKILTQNNNSNRQKQKYLRVTANSLRQKTTRLINMNKNKEMQAAYRAPAWRVPPGRPRGAPRQRQPKAGLDMPLKSCEIPRDGRGRVRGRLPRGRRWYF